MGEVISDSGIGVDARKRILDAARNNKWQAVDRRLGDISDIQQLMQFKVFAAANWTDQLKDKLPVLLQRIDTRLQALGVIGIAEQPQPRAARPVEEPALAPAPRGPAPAAAPKPAPAAVAAPVRPAVASTPARPTSAAPAQARPATVSASAPRPSAAPAPKPAPAPVATAAAPIAAASAQAARPPVQARGPAPAAHPRAEASSAPRTHSREGR